MKLENIIRKTKAKLATALIGASSIFAGCDGEGLFFPIDNMNSNDYLSRCVYNSEDLDLLSSAEDVKVIDSGKCLFDGEELGVFYPIDDAKANDSDKVANERRFGPIDASWGQHGPKVSIGGPFNTSFNVRAGTDNNNPRFHLNVELYSPIFPKGKNPNFHIYPGDIVRVGQRMMNGAAGIISRIPRGSYFPVFCIEPMCSYISQQQRNSRGEL